MEINEIKSKLKDVLTDKRYKHTKGVAYTAMCMAMVYDVDLNKAELAGYLHDNAKCLSDEKLLKKCLKHKIELTKVEKDNPYLLHAKLGAYYAKSKYGIDDEEIISAIRYHTTGRPSMSILEKIIFIADYIEPGRNKAANLREVRKLAFTDINMCIYVITKDTLEYLGSDKSSIDDTTEKTYLYYKELIESR